VLDFVGLHRREFRFDRRFGALLGGSRRELAQQIENGFPFLPAGCHMELDSVARDIVLRSIREAVPSRWAEKVDELQKIAAGGNVPSLGAYLDEAGLDLTVRASGPNEKTLRRAIGRVLHVDDALRIETWQRLLSQDTAPNVAMLAKRDKRLIRMLVASLLDKAVAKSTSLAEGLGLLWRHPQVRAELAELLDVLRERMDHMNHALLSHPDVPLRVYARYTRVEILAGFGVGESAKIPPWQAGVYWAEDAHTDLFAFTLDKTSGQFSPTTRYRDYAISRELIHWESQSITRADSETGQRYQKHVARGTHVMLFARLRTDSRAFWFLGPATYVSHESERPMAVTWRLEHPLPGDVFAAFAAAVA